MRAAPTSAVKCGNPVNIRWKTAASNPAQSRRSSSSQLGSTPRSQPAATGAGRRVTDSRRRSSTNASESSDATNGSTRIRFDATLEGFHVEAPHRGRTTTLTEVRTHISSVAPLPTPPGHQGTAVFGDLGSGTEAVAPDSRSDSGRQRVVPGVGHGHRLLSTRWRSARARCETSALKAMASYSCGTPGCRCSSTGTPPWLRVSA